MEGVAYPASYTRLYLFNPESVTILEMLPGEEIIKEGIRDLNNGLETIPSLLVSIGAPRLRQIGLSIPGVLFDSPELRLYNLLKATEPDTSHSRYNALIRRLVSFERAAECET